ncbi:MAG: hypothetical protein J6X44_05195 [Thermoguttaceae bacterium]|nr:hypothetical protein [Thermoguttaceae bacterium]
MNGVPVIGSTRGAIPETTGQAGTLLEIDSKYQPETKTIPTAEDVVPRIDEIVKLWDDSEYYAKRRRLCLQNAERWDYAKVLDKYVDCLARLLL